MAGEIGLHKILLYDHWPGEPNPNLGVPAGGWDNTSTCQCQSVAYYPPGTKASAYSDFTYCPGNYVMCYMMYSEGGTFSDDLLAISEGGGICADTGDDCDTETDALSACYGTVHDITYSKWWIITNDFANSEASHCGRVAVGIGAMCEGEFGWFWVGGVCPAADITWYDQQTGGVGTEMLGEGNIVQGSKLMPANDATGAVVLIPWDGTWEYMPCGLALEADA